MELINLFAKISFFIDSPQHLHAYMITGFTKESISLRYVPIRFSFDLLNIFLLKTMFFLPFLIRFSMPTYFFPDDTNVKPK